MDPIQLKSEIIALLQQVDDPEILRPIHHLLSAKVHNRPFSTDVLKGNQMPHNSMGIEVQMMDPGDEASQPSE